MPIDAEPPELPAILKTGLLGLFYFITLALAFSLTGFIIFAQL